MRNSILGGLIGVLLGGLVFAACGGSGTVTVALTQAELDAQVALLQAQIDALQADLDTHKADPDAHHPAAVGTDPRLGMTWCIAITGLFPSRSLTAPIIEEGGSTQISNDPYLGSVALFAGNFAPRGWMKCEGQLLDIASNMALFSILGTQFGGDGRTTFALPDLRGGRDPVHADQSTIDVGDRID